MDLPLSHVISCCSWSKGDLLLLPIRPEDLCHVQLRITPSWIVVGSKSLLPRRLSTLHIPHNNSGLFRHDSRHVKLLASLWIASLVVSPGGMLHSVVPSCVGLVDTHSVAFGFHYHYPLGSASRLDHSVVVDFFLFLLSTILISLFLSQVTVSGSDWLLFPVHLFAILVWFWFNSWSHSIGDTVHSWTWSITTYLC